MKESIEIAMLKHIHCVGEVYWKLVESAELFNLGSGHLISPADWIKVIKALKKEGLVRVSGVSREAVLPYFKTRTLYEVSPKGHKLLKELGT